MPRPIAIVPRFARDFSRLGDACVALQKAGVDRIQWDVMDGHFVPNLTFGPDLIASIRPHVTVPFEAHLMVERPDELLPRFVEAGCELIIVHAEACTHLHRTVGSHSRARRLGGGRPQSGDTGVRRVACDGPDRSVARDDGQPRLRRQKYIATMEAKIDEIVGMRDDRGFDFDIEVDGGIGVTTVAGAVRAGANVLVAGTALFKDPEGLEHAVTELRAQAHAALG
jgi:ribulose-phosphate 3-epimerase